MFGCFRIGSTSEAFRITSKHSRYESDLNRRPFGTSDPVGSVGSDCRIRVGSEWEVFRILSRYWYPSRRYFGSRLDVLISEEELNWISFGSLLNIQDPSRSLIGGLLDVLSRYIYYIYHTYTMQYTKYWYSDISGPNIYFYIEEFVRTIIKNKT